MKQNWSGISKGVEGSNLRSLLEDGGGGGGGYGHFLEQHNSIH